MKQTFETFISTTVTIFHTVDEFYNVHITVASCHLPNTKRKEYQLLARRKRLAFKATKRKYKVFKPILK